MYVCIICSNIDCILFWVCMFYYCLAGVQILIYTSYLVSRSVWEAQIPLQGRPAPNELFSLLMKVRTEPHLSFCDNLSLSPVISVAPLILIVLYNCGMCTSRSLKYCPYPFIITRCLEPLYISSFYCSALYYPVLQNKRESSLSLVF